MPNLPRLKEISSGFTLIELLVVVAIIAILAVVSLALFGNVQKAARDGVRRSNIDTLAKNLETRFDYGSSLYQQLDPNDFSEGVIPKDPDGSSYNGVPQSATASFQLCAALDNHPLRSCNSPSQTCFCKSSMRGDLASIGVYNGTFHPVSCDPNGTLDDGLVGYWKMDETTSPFLDYSGNNNTGTWVGGVGTAPGVRVSPYDFKNAGNFDGVNSYVDGIGASLQNLPNVTIAAWVNPTATPVFGNVVAKYSYANGGMILRISQISNGRLTPHIYTDTWHTCSGSVIPLNVWTHVAIRYDGTTLKGYVNGLEDCTTTPAVGGNLSLNPTAFLIDTTGGDHFPGLIDDVRIYNRALSPDEVQVLYGTNPPGSGCLPS